jgi:hypothetical protein
MEVSAKVEWIPGARDLILGFPDKTMYQVARMTLDYTEPHIPFNTGTMEKTSMREGVKGSSGNYYIGSFTDYASYVWQMGKNTNWTNPSSYPKWFQTVWKEKGSNIVKQAVERNKLK